MPIWLDRELTSLAFLWRLERRDGVTLGFTSHDRNLVRDGLIYRAAPGMQPSAIERSDGLEAGSVELSGMLTSDAISARDLDLGRWDGAALRLVAVDWSDPEGQAVHLIRGRLGTVEHAGERFSAELRDATSILDAAVVEETSPDCRARLGDARCRVDMAGRTVLVGIIAIDGIAVTLDRGFTTGRFGSGRLRFLEGDRAGLSPIIAASDGTSLTLREPLPFEVSPGTRVEITEGCDRAFATCRDRFANVLNFRGEPHLPGNDLLTRYASQG